MEYITEPTPAGPAQAGPAQADESSAAPGGAATDVIADTEFEGLDDLDDVNFDLDEVENKIAPLALAVNESVRW
jgi:hypothetical protein